jgi:hypothetical protein
MNPRGRRLASWFCRVIHFEQHFVRRGSSDDTSRTERCQLFSFRRSMLARSNRFSFRTALSSLCDVQHQDQFLCLSLPFLPVRYAAFPLPMINPAASTRIASLYPIISIN